MVPQAPKGAPPLFGGHTHSMPSEALVRLIARKPGNDGAWASLSLDTLGCRVVSVASDQQTVRRRDTSNLAPRNARSTGLHPWAGEGRCQATCPTDAATGNGPS